MSLSHSSLCLRRWRETFRAFLGVVVFLLLINPIYAQYGLTWTAGTETAGQTAITQGRYADAVRELQPLVASMPEFEVRTDTQLGITLDLARAHYGAGDLAVATSELARLGAMLRSLNKPFFLGATLQLAAEVGYQMPHAEQLAMANEGRDLLELADVASPLDRLRALGTLILIVMEVDAARATELGKSLQERVALEMSLKPRDRSWFNLIYGMSLFRAGNRKDGESVLTSALVDLRALLGPNHPDTLFASYQALLALQRRGAHADASAGLRTLEQKQATVLGDDHPQRVRSLVLLLGEQTRAREWDLATQSLSSIVEVTRRRYGIDSVRYLDTQNDVADLLYARGLFGQAEAVQTQTLKALEAKALGGTAYLRGLYTLAMILSSMDRLQEAISTFQQIYLLDQTRLPPGHPDSWPVLSNLATLYSRIGDRDRALMGYRTVERAMRDRLDPTHANLISVQSNMGAQLLELGRSKEAVELLQSIISRIEPVRKPDDGQLLRARSNLASAYAAQKNYALALEMHQKVLDGRRQTLPTYHPEILNTMHQIAFTIEAQGEARLALEKYSEVYELRRKYLGEVHVDTLRSARSRAGILFEKIQDKPAASAAYAHIVEIIEKLRDSGPVSEQLRQQYFREFAQAYKMHARILGELGQWDQAFAAAERSKARTLVEQTRQRMSGLVNRLSKEEGGNFTRLEKQVANLNVRLALFSGEKAETTPLVIEAERDARLRELNELRVRLSAKYGLDTLALPVGPASVSRAGTDLEDGDLFISFSMMGEALLVFTLDKDGHIDGKVTNSKSGLVGSIDALRRLVSHPRGLAYFQVGDDRTPAHALWKLPQGGFALTPIADGAPEGATQVFSADPIVTFVSETLLAAMPAGVWSATRLIISPDEQLAQLPFEMLRNAGKAWIEKHEIVLAQSWTMHTLLKERERIYATSSRRPLLVFGNARYGSTPLPAGAVSGYALRGPDGATVSGSRRRGPFSDFSWYNLPGSAKEVQAMKRRFGLREGVDLFEGDQASESNLLRLDKAGALSNYRLILLSAHGYLHPRQPLLSSIVLAQPEFSKDGQRSDEDDGYVTAVEWMALKLQTDLVVLSACESGLGGIVSGEGVTGLPFGLFAAGNRSTLMTLWSIYDGSSGIFVDRFFEKVKAGRRFSTALALTKREFLSGKAGRQWTAPAHWAPFVMYGM